LSGSPRRGGRRANGSRHRDDVSTRRDDGADRGPDVCGEPSDSWVITVPSRPTLPALTIGSNLPLMVGAVIYVRVSTKEQTEHLSLPTKLRACEEYCRRQGYEILE